MAHGASLPVSGARGGQEEVVAFLASLAGGKPVETHISLVFLGRDEAWKLKKAVRLSFLDFTTLEARERFCRRELALNAPAAPGLYRDVVPVVRRDGRLALGGEGEVVDWVLRMARVPEEDFLDRIAERDTMPLSQDAIEDHLIIVLRRVARGELPGAATARGSVADQVDRLLLVVQVENHKLRENRRHGRAATACRNRSARRQ